MRTYDDLIEHIIEGEVTASGKVKGIHSKLAEAKGARIDSIVSAEDKEGIYSAHVSKMDANGIYRPKIDKKGNLIKNDMFPDDWDTAQKFKEEITHAFNNKVFDTDSANRWEATMSNGRQCILCISGPTTNIDINTRIITTWPIR